MRLSAKRLALQSVYRRIRYFSNIRCRPLFRHEHGYWVQPRILSRFAEVPQSVPGCPIDFLPLRSLSLARCRARLESAWRKRIHRAALHPFKLWPSGSFVYSRIHYPAKATGSNFQTQFVTLLCPYSYFSFARFVIERVSRPAVRARRRRFQHRPTLAINNFPFRRISWSLNWHIRSTASSIIVTGRVVLEEVAYLWDRRRQCQCASSDVTFASR